MFALSLAKQVREMINSSAVMGEGLVPVARAFFSTWGAAATPRRSQRGLANGASREAACLKRSTNRKGWNLLKEELSWFVAGFFLMSKKLPPSWFPQKRDAAPERAKEETQSSLAAFLKILL